MLINPKHTVLKPSGWIHQFNGDARDAEMDTKCCCHCGMHWIVKPGSGNIRGFCTGCNDHTCGNPDCDPCMPMEKRLDLYEKGVLKTL